MQEKIDIVIPSIPNDVGILLHNIEWFASFLPMKQIVVIGPPEVADMLSPYERVKFVHEEEIIDKCTIEKCILKKAGGRPVRSGWYIQQFLKMKYSLLCNDEYYLLWDSDTLPLKETPLFDKMGKPVFHMKKEYNEPYFRTIENLFHGLKKQVRESFISEHMIIKTDYMKSLILTIENNHSLSGQSFEEKIINAIYSDDFCNNGFSEFETYGTYILSNYPDAYSLKEWKSLRFGGFFFPQDSLMSPDTINWMSGYYDAISFEKKHHLTIMGKIVNKKLFQKLFPPQSLDYLSVIPRLYSKMFR